MFVFEWAMRPPAITWEWIGYDVETVLSAYEEPGEQLAGIVGERGAPGPQHTFVQASAPAEMSYPQVWYKPNGDGTYTQFISTGV